MRNGVDVQLEDGIQTYTEMLYQICREYPGLPDPRTLSADEIIFWYEGLRHELRKVTKPKSGKRAW